MASDLFRFISGRKAGFDAHVPNTAQATAFSKPRTASRTNITLLVNATDKTLMLRDKIGPSYGQVRYSIEKHSQIEVSSVNHTFYKMLAYVIEEKIEGEQSASGVGMRKRVCTDTMLSIDCDELAQNKKIVILCEGGKYTVRKQP